MSLQSFLKTPTAEQVETCIWDRFLLDDEDHTATEALITAQNNLERIYSKYTSLVQLQGADVEKQDITIKAILTSDEYQAIVASMPVTVTEKSVDVISHIIAALYNAFLVTVRAVLKLMEDYLGNFFSAAIRIKNASEVLLGRVNKMTGKPKESEITLDDSFSMVMGQDGNVDLTLFSKGIKDQIDELTEIVSSKNYNTRFSNRNEAKTVLRGDTSYRGGKVEAWDNKTIRDYTHQLVLDCAEVIGLKKYTLPFLKAKTSYLAKEIKEYKASNDAEAQHEAEQAREEVNQLVDIIKGSCRSFTAQNKTRYRLILLMAKNIE